MPYIQNVSYEAIKNGEHLSAHNAILIQIVDYGLEFPQPKAKFREVYQFEFMDIELGDKLYNEHPELAINDEQAMQIANILRDAYDSGYDVVVHCVAGVCRSGAVAEVGIMYGFEDTNAYRLPNLLVKQKVKDAIGLHWSWE